MNSLLYRLIFDLGPFKDRDRKEPFKSSKITKVDRKIVVKYGKYSLAKFANFLYFLCYVWKLLPFFEPKVATISTRNTIMRKFANFVFEVIFCTLQHFQRQFGILLLLKSFFFSLQWKYPYIFNFLAFRNVLTLLRCGYPVCLTYGS